MGKRYGDSTKRGGWTTYADRNERLRERRRDGATYAQLAAEFGISQERCRQIVKAAEPPPKRWEDSTPGYEAFKMRGEQRAAETNLPPEKADAIRECGIDEAAWNYWVAQVPQLHRREMWTDHLDAVRVRTADKVYEVALRVFRGDGVEDE